MRVAVIGGGTAGVMAVTHLSQLHRDLDVYHLYDSTLPPIGVGEGTTHGFLSWLNQWMPDATERLRHECAATIKTGIRFEGWGITRPEFFHDFIPTERYAVHLSADAIPDFLAPLMRAEVIDDRVVELVSDDQGVVVHTRANPPLTAELVIDARGFPKTLSHHQTDLSWIPTNAALVTRLSTPRPLAQTRAVARPHGWVFVIPLQTHTSYGYVFDTRSSEPTEAARDFEEFLAEEGNTAERDPRLIRFPNFVDQQLFDGRVFKIGNAASFIEPLEATSIATIKEQLTAVSTWLNMGALTRGQARAQLVKATNDYLVNAIMELSVFVGWHYSMGSQFETTFWRTARRRFREAMESGLTEAIRAAFEQQLLLGWPLPADGMRRIETEEELDDLIPGRASFPKPFGGITPLSFAQIADGLVGLKNSTAEQHLEMIGHA